MASNIFEKVLENVDIQTVVSEYVTLEPAGKDLVGICPFHDDHKPSMRVTKELGIYKCFSCGSGGNAINFIENYKHLSKIEACKYLANEYHIDISEYNTGPVDKNKTNYEIMQTTSKFFKFLMNDEEYSKEARSYLEKRGITDEIIEEFNLGLSPNDFDSLSKTLLSKGFTDYEMELNGLKSSGHDIFVNRIIVPINDELGRTVAFGGRIYKDIDKSQAKYLNSKETPIFKKSKLLFNLDRASRAINPSNPYLIINEGYMDVISASSIGIKNSIALMGTALTDEQASLIKKYTNNVIICLDSDEAGMRAVSKVINKLEDNGINYSVAILNGAKDPDEFIRKFGKEKYLELLINYGLDKFGYIYELTKLDYPKVNSFNMESFKKTIFNNLKSINSKATLEIYLRRLSSDLKVSYESISQDFESYMVQINPNFKITKGQTKVQPTFKVSNSFKKAEKMIIDYSLKSYDYYRIIEKKFNSRVFLKDLSLRALFVEIGDIYDENYNISTEDLIYSLKQRGSYNSFNFDMNTQFTEDDLKNNVLRSFDKNLLKERQAELIERLKEVDIKSIEGIKLQKELLEVIKEIKK